MAPAATAIDHTLNPALFLLLALAALGLLARRREGGVSWWVAGVAATALLAGALALPDGIPSQARLLTADAPWAGRVEPGAANPQLLDVTHQVEPWLLFLRHELRAGRLPFWDPHQLAGEPFWSNGSSAPLFPLHLLFVALPVRLGLLLLPWLRVAIGGCGAAALARQLGVSPRASLVAAVAYPLSGTVVSFLLFPMGNTHALVPWVLLAVERIAAGSGSWPALAIAGGLQLLGGHPETPLFTALLAVVWLVARGTREAPARGELTPTADIPESQKSGWWRSPAITAAGRIWGRFVVGWVVAGAIAAIQNVPLAATALDSSKWLHWHPPTPIPWAVRGALLLRAVLPHPFGSASDGTWWGPYNDPATAIYAGAATLALAFAALPLARRDPRWRAVVAFTLAALLGAYHFPLAKELLLALPLVSHGLHHYLKVGLELGLALLAAAGWQRWIDGEARRALAIGAAAELGLLALAAAVFVRHWQERGQTATQLAWVAFAAVVAFAMLGLALARLPPAARERLAWVVPALLLGDLAVAHSGINPGAPTASLYPLTPAVELLRTVPGRVAATGSTLRPDAAMVYGLDDVRGDSPVKLERYQRVYARLAANDPIYFRPIERWQDPWLDALAVRWVMGRAGERSPDPRWRLAYDGADARIWERPGALPLVRWESTTGAMVGEPPQVQLRAPGRWRIAWRTDRPRRLIVAETWDPGWSAEAGERPRRVDAWRGALLTVNVPAGEGVVELRYVPRGFALGAALSALGVLAVAAGGWKGRLSAPRPRAALRG
jgi:hypothetical protein